MENIYTKEMEQINLYHQATQPTKDEQDFINAHLMLTELVDTIPTMTLSYHGTPTESDFIDILGLSSWDYETIYYGDYDNEYLKSAYSIIEHYYNDNDDLMNAILEYYE